MITDGYFYVNKPLEEVLFEELQDHCKSGGGVSILSHETIISHISLMSMIHWTLLMT